MSNNILILRRYTPMYLGWKTNLFSKITTVAYEYTSCTYYTCLHTHAHRENKCDKISDLGEQYMGFILVYGVLVLQLSCRFAFFQKEKFEKKQTRRGMEEKRKRGLETFEAPPETPVWMPQSLPAVPRDLTLAWMTLLAVCCVHRTCIFLQIHWDETVGRKKGMLTCSLVSWEGFVCSLEQQRKLLLHLGGSPFSLDSLHNALQALSRNFDSLGNISLAAFSLRYFCLMLLGPIN